MEDALYEIESMRRFAGMELKEDAIPDETTILKSRRFLEQRGLAKKMLEAVPMLESADGEEAIAANGRRDASASRACGGIKGVDRPKATAFARNRADDDDKWSRRQVVTTSSRMCFVQGMPSIRSSSLRARPAFAGMMAREGTTRLGAAAARTTAAERQE